MIDSNPRYEHFSMTLMVFFYEVKLLVDSTEQNIQTSCDAQTGMNFIQVSFQQVTQFLTKMGASRTYPDIYQVTPLVPLVYSKLSL